MSQVNIITDQFTLDNFKNTSWIEMGKDYGPKDKQKIEKFFSTLGKCCCCSKLVVDCELEDKIRGFGDDPQAQDKYYPL